MAGDRSLPDDGVVTWNHAPSESDFGKYRGKRFSEVIAEDADYVTWARQQEEKGRTPRWGRPCLEASVSEGVRLWRRPCLEASVSGGVRVWRRPCLSGGVRVWKRPCLLEASCASAAAHLEAVISKGLHHASLEPLFPKQRKLKGPI